jgi:NADH-quinone oxidoreductase subunit K
MNEPALLRNLLAIGAILFATGVVGILARRNMIVMFLSAELSLQGIAVSLVAWSRYHNNLGGQMLVIFIIAVAACEAAIALALFVKLFHDRGTLDVVAWQSLREENQPPHVDIEVPDPDAREAKWPVLTPAGIEPAPDLQQERHRARV